VEQVQNLMIAFFSEDYLPPVHGNAVHSSSYLGLYNRHWMSKVDKKSALCIELVNKLVVMVELHKGG
jgi:hypothetical protein